MKYALFTWLLVAILTATTYGQKKDEINFSDPLQIDSSEYFLIPKLMDDKSQPAYGKGKGYLPWDSYTEIYFYNAKTNTSKAIFGGKLALAVPFRSRRYNEYPPKEKESPANILPNHIVYLVRTENYSGDNALDTDDPIYLYISTKTGENLKQVTPRGFSVNSWSVSADNSMILVQGRSDNNGNKTFGKGDDEVYYRIDLDKDISKIKCYPIVL